MGAADFRRKHPPRREVIDCELGCLALFSLLFSALLCLFFDKKVDGAFLLIFSAISVAVSLAVGVAANWISQQRERRQREDLKKWLEKK